MTAPRGGRHGRTINSKANFVILPVNQLPYGVCGENWGKSTGIRSSRRNATFHRHKLYSISSSVTTTPSALICLDLSPLLVHFIPFFIRIIIIIYFYTFFLILELLKKKLKYLDMEMGGSGGWPSTAFSICRRGPVDQITWFESCGGLKRQRSRVVLFKRMTTLAWGKLVAYKSDSVISRSVMIEGKPPFFKGDLVSVIL